MSFPWPAAAVVACSFAFASPRGVAASEAPSAAAISYAVSFAAGEQRAQVELIVPPGHAAFVMWNGASPDERSRHVIGLRARTADGAVVPVRYEPQAARWDVEVAADKPLRIAYDVELGYLRSLPQWARLQNGFFEGSDLYLVTKSLFVVPDSLDSSLAASVRFRLPRGAAVIAPWTPVAGETESFEAPLRSLANDTIDVGSMPVVVFRQGGFDVNVVLFGAMRRYEKLVRRVAVRSLAAYTTLFAGTPRARFVFTAALGDEDGQAFDDSGAISTAAPVPGENEPIWANTIAHELFHFWNGRRIKPNSRRLQAITEGFTEYYANRTLLRTGIIDASTYWQIAARHLGAYSYFWFSPNYNVSLIDAGLNKTKNRFGVYDGGWTLALCVDLELRRSSGGRRTLDNVMRVLWTRFGRRGVAYSYADFVDALTTAAGHDFGPFAGRYLVGTDELPYRADLASLGVHAYTETFGGKVYLVVKPHSASERRAYARFIGR
ncbi:MAG: hypothetical protein JO036_09295 [Candidatus Eremiobacteraeota bacterium]|nr:hypothetical protein [Candidatus Eremiobacteraeota bacterium]